MSHLLHQHPTGCLKVDIFIHNNLYNILSSNTRYNFIHKTVHIAVRLYSDASTDFTKTVLETEYTKKFINCVNLCAAGPPVTHNGDIILLPHGPNLFHLGFYFFVFSFKIFGAHIIYGGGLYTLPSFDNNIKNSLKIGESLTAGGMFL